MQTFVVIVLIVIIIALTHFHNFVVRRLFEDKSDEGTFIVLSFVSAIYGFAMYLSFKYLIIWAYPLIQK